LKDRAWWLKHT